MEVRHIRFSELRKAYLTVQEILKTDFGIDDILSLNFKTEDDGGISGDDAVELLNLLSEKYDVDFTDFDFSKHFMPEGFEPIGLLFLLIWIVKTIINMFFEILFLCSGKKVKFKPFVFENKKLLDLTFGDLVTSFLEKKFTYRHQIKYVLIE